MVAALIALVVAGGVAQPALAAAPAENYVALGDSFTAGPLILPQTDALTCFRSKVNYAGLLASRRHVASFHDVSCSAAETADFTNPQKGIVLGTNAPQYDALQANTTLVTVGIGGNDIGLIELAEACITVVPGLSAGCAPKAGAADVFAQRIDAFAPTYATVIAQIRARSPHARIALVGYPTGIKPNGCYPFVPVVAKDANYLQSMIDRLNLRMKEQAEANGATYVDLRSPSVGHDACQAIGTRWMEGVVPLSTNGFTPLHPNALAMQHAATTIDATLGRA